MESEYEETKITIPEHAFRELQRDARRATELQLRVEILEAQREALLNALATKP